MFGRDFIESWAGGGGGGDEELSRTRIVKKRILRLYQTDGLGIKGSRFIPNNYHNSIDYFTI